MKRVLIVSPHFTPVNAPDMQRVRMSLPHYRAGGWEPVVLCVGDAWQDGVREPELAQTVPADVKIYRSPAWSLRWTRWIGLRNLGLRCWLHFLIHGARLIAREKIDLVFFSNTQFVTFTLGRIWRALFGTPYVFDMQDPWRTDYYERPGSRRPPGGWKYQVARLMAWTFEGWSFRRVAAVMSVSSGYLDDLRGRYSWLAHTPAAVINFGVSRADLDLALALPPPAVRFHRQPGDVHIVYTGASGPVMPHALTILFDALRHYRAVNPASARRLHFHFYGTSYVAPGQGRNSVIPVAESCGVADQVDEIPHRIGFLESLRLQREADVLLLPGSTDRAYSPSKIYPYYLAGRPVLAVVFAQSVLERRLQELSFANMVTIREGKDTAEAWTALAGFFDLAVAGFPDGAQPRRNDAFFETNYLADRLAAAQCRLFDRAHAHAASDP